MNYKNQIGSGADIAEELERIYNDTEALASWLDECKDFEARGWVSIETDRRLKASGKTVYAV